MGNVLRLITGYPGPSGFGSSSTAEQVTHGVDATNLTAIVTGGASGIGLETARVLALRNANVIIAARNTKAASDAKELILKDNASARVDVLQLDLCSLDSITEFADNFLALNVPLNILINNAGVMFCPYQLSKDGIEVQFATNHIGHFLLTNLLLDKMKETARATGIEGRIVNLTSIAHVHTYKNGIRFDKINEKKGYSDKRAYGQSKLANILHANELSRRLKEEGANITANSVHPGIIMTNLMRHSYFLMRCLNLLTGLLIWKNVPQVLVQQLHHIGLTKNSNIITTSQVKTADICPLFLLYTNYQGAATTCYVALNPKVKGVTGKYFEDCNELTPSAKAKDQALAKKLWDFSEKLVNSGSNHGRV